ncbi:MAG: ABC transporter permease [Ignavibacteria bacterium]|nr:ABC transporter permease [Ignavibacteria bacterium]
MQLLIKLAWRNISRNKRRLFLTLTAITFATLASIIMRGVQLGTYAVNIRNAVNIFTGYLQIQQKDFQKNPSLKYNFTPDELTLKEVKSVSDVKGFSERIYGDGLISFRDNSAGAAIFGINPQQERRVTNIMERIHEGKFFDTDTTNEAVVGYTLLENLKAKINDEIVILSQGSDGSLGNLKFKITGTIKTGMQDIDVSAIFIGLEKAQELLELKNKIHTIVITLNDLNDIEEVKGELEQRITNNNLKILSWDELMPEFKQSIELDNIGGIFFLIILIIIVAFGVLNTVLMSVMERFNEFGIALSIGMSQINLAVLVVIETFFITIPGIILGNMIGWVINFYIILNPIEIGSELGQMYEEYGFLPVIESSVNYEIFINTDIAILLTAFIACFYPFYRVYKLEPLKGIRYT